MYDKVKADLKFVDREREVEKFWEENHIFEKVLIRERRGRPTLSMTDRLQQTESPISAMFSPV